MEIPEEVRLSRLRVSRRRALSLGGTIGFGGLLAACGSDSGSTGSTKTAVTLSPGTPASAEIIAALNSAATCSLSKEVTQGPYWFDVDSIRSDIREKRPGTTLNLALRVQDMAKCAPSGEPAPIANSVVEIWHCDAGGMYSGFESGSAGPGGEGPGGTPPSGGPPAGGPPSGGPPSGGPGGQPPSGGPGGGNPGGASSGGTSDGSYSKGDNEAKTSDDGTYLRGAQVADATGIAQFTTIYPGWYRGRTPHIHLKVHIDKKTVLTAQLFFDDVLTDEAYRKTPYSSRPNRDTRNANDSIYSESGLLTVKQQGDGYLGLINLGVNLTA